MNGLKQIEKLYELPITATRSGPLFNAHAYPTKISPESVALLIACHTKPGDVVFDGFGGSGTTALASLLCARPSTELQAEAELRRLKPCWGPRRAIVYELSGLGSFIAETLCSKPDPGEFTQAATRILQEAERRFGWIYSARDPVSNSSVARYFVWSDDLCCPACKVSTSLWAACVHVKPARISDSFRCPNCDHACSLDNARRVTCCKYDDLLGEKVLGKRRVLARVSGFTGGHLWSRPPVREDLELVQRIQSEQVPPSFPLVPMMGRGGKAWGDLWRAGYHEGITHVHHFYTRRNLIALATIHELIENEPPKLRNALYLWLSSYNSSHSTLMTRVVAKKSHDDLVLTSAQPGVLYISGLPVEKNVFRGLSRKMKTIEQAFSLLKDSQGDTKIIQASSTRTHLPDSSVDYVFTDPPFGGNIPYSEVNFIAEAWLGRTTNVSEEAIVSPTQGKGIDCYKRLLVQAFSELKRILRPNGRVTLIFHSTQSAVWEALVNAYTEAGFSVQLSNILDKRQGSFKQVTTTNSAKGDALILLRPMVSLLHAPNLQAREIIQLMLAQVDQRQGKASDESTPQRLYSRFVEHYLKNHLPPPMDAEQFYAELGLERSRK